MQIGRWSKSRYGRSDVLFVTVCVDIRPKPVAREFQRTYFDKAGSSIINAFIEERNDYPKFPTQLGCQGLLVLDCEGNIATMRSTAFLDFREKAFEDLEHLLEPLVAAGKARQQIATTPSSTSSESLVPSKHLNSNNRLNSISSFSLNACSEEAVSLDENWDSSDFQLPLIQHESIDEEHAVLEGLMRTAVRTQEIGDVQALKIFFVQHSVHEESIMRRSGFTAGEDSNFSAIESHIRDHTNIVNFAESILHNAREGSRRKLTVPQVTLLCRRIIEHVFTYDILLTGTLDVE